MFKCRLLLSTTACSLLVLKNTFVSSSIRCEDNNSSENDRNEWIRKIIGKSKDVLDTVNPRLQSFFEGIPQEKILEKISVFTYENISSGVPGQVGYGFLMGYSSGYCLKRVSKFLAFVVGGLFISIQTLSYHGYIAVNYGKIQQEVEGVLDLNKDGKVDAEDMKLVYEKIQNILSYNMPTGGGFSVGFFMGIRS